MHRCWYDPRGVAYRVIPKIVCSSYWKWLQSFFASKRKWASSNVSTRYLHDLWRNWGETRTIPAFILEIRRTGIGRDSEWLTSTFESSILETMFRGEWERQKLAISLKVNLYAFFISPCLIFRYYGESDSEDVQQDATAHRSCMWSIRATVWSSVSQFYGW